MHEICFNGRSNVSAACGKLCLLSVEFDPLLRQLLLLVTVTRYSLNYSQLTTVSLSGAENRTHWRVGVVDYSCDFCSEFRDQYANENINT